MSTKIIDFQEETTSDLSYRGLIKRLFNIDLSEEEASTHYDNIMFHQDHLMSNLGRDVGFSVAALDYFTYVKSMLNPKRESKQHPKKKQTNKTDMKNVTNSTRKPPQNTRQ